MIDNLANVSVSGVQRHPCVPDKLPQKLSRSWKPGAVVCLYCEKARNIRKCVELKNATLPEYKNSCLSSGHKAISCACNTCKSMLRSFIQENEVEE